MAANNIEKKKPEIEKNEHEIVNLNQLPPENTIKHPLQDTWTLWYYQPDKNRTWEESQLQILTFDTIEDFWALYKHIKPASELRQGTDYSLFKQGIQPMWEDNANKHGGRWLINLDKRQRASVLEKYWLEIMVAMIGNIEFREQNAEICGAVVNVRPKGDKLALWTADFKKEKENKEIGRTLKKVLEMTDRMPIGYQVHNDAMVKSGSITKTTYQV